MSLPLRVSPRPRTTLTNPHSQLDQQPDRSVIEGLMERLRAMPGVEVAPSHRAPPRTLGFHLPAAAAGGPEEAFLLGREFAHVHPGADGSLHLTLPPGLREDAMRAGWAEPHPLAGVPTVSRQIVMVYAPRDAAEVGVVADLVDASRRYAAGEALRS
ncbi:luciferase domain-containing protein [Falsiroseomonas sp. E2-1-a20]|uniref:luciferase domain-containing protein n=1 Tax=Falsiroseomonas sp. E2-1-a20 TaxID=3239300 RepID=UPI003F2A004F